LTALGILRRSSVAARIPNAEVKFYLENLFSLEFFESGSTLEVQELSYKFQRNNKARLNTTRGEKKTNNLIERSFV